MQRGGEPGEIRHFDQQDWPDYGHGLSSHGFGVLAALSLARELGSLPRRLDLYGIEIGSVNPGQKPDDRIHAAAQQLAAMIMSSLEDEAG